jgi:ribose 5-phosphate isomerase B
MLQDIIALGADHRGYNLKEIIKARLSNAGFSIIDVGAYNNSDSVDYPDYAKLVAESIEIGNATKGILICGTGIGMSIAANRHKKIRAALCHNEETAELCRKHNYANVLVLGSSSVDEQTALTCVDKFLNTEFEGGRHQSRINKFS